MRPQAEYELVLSLLGQGLNDSEVSRRTGVPRGTVRDWRHARLAGSSGRTPRAQGVRGGAGDGTCPVCHERWLDQRSYAYLLGLYLGDGWISRQRGSSHRLRIILDLRYPEIIDECARTMAAVRGCEEVGFRMANGCVEVNKGWWHWPCLFPQHGEGRKHHRPIRLGGWQEEILRLHPRDLLRGLIHSDGSRHVNTVVRSLASGPRTYRYPRYTFSNVSEDILGVFTSACEVLGLSWTRANSHTVAVSRREDVAFLDSFIGPKA